MIKDTELTLRTDKYCFHIEITEKEWQVLQIFRVNTHDELFTIRIKYSGGKYNIEVSMPSTDGDEGEVIYTKKEEGKYLSDIILSAFDYITFDTINDVYFYPEMHRKIASELYNDEGLYTVITHITTVLPFMG